MRNAFALTRAVKIYLCKQYFSFFQVSPTQEDQPLSSASSLPQFTVRSFASTSVQPFGMAITGFKSAQ